MATGLPVVTEYPYDERYTSTGIYALTDGITGTLSYLNGEWQGYWGVDFVGTIDLLTEKEVSKVSAGFINSVSSGIFLPKGIEVFTSQDNKHFTSVAIFKNDIPVLDEGEFTKTFTVNFSKTKARFIRIIAKTIGRCPQGHKYEGAEAFIFIDEIIV